MAKLVSTIVNANEPQPNMDGEFPVLDRNLLISAYKRENILNTDLNLPISLNMNLTILVLILVSIFYQIVCVSVIPTVKNLASYEAEKSTKINSLLES